jgi:hypothetical protein
MGAFVAKSETANTTSEPASPRIRNQLFITTDYTTSLSTWETQTAALGHRLMLSPERDLLAGLISQLSFKRTVKDGGEQGVHLSRDLQWM